MTARGDQIVRYARNKTLGAWALTIVYVVGFVLYVWRRPVDLLTLEPNALGDMVAGLSAPLAFGWLIFGYSLQRDQIALQSEQIAMQMEELRLQREELRASTDANREQADQLRRQAEILDLQYREAQARFDRESTPRLRMVFDEKHSASSVRATLENRGVAVSHLRLNTLQLPWTGNTLMVNEPFENSETADIRAQRPTGTPAGPLKLSFTCKSTLNGETYFVDFQLEEGRRFYSTVEKMKPIEGGPNLEFLGWKR